MVTLSDFFFFIVVNVVGKFTICDQNKPSVALSTSSASTFYFSFGHSLSPGYRLYFSFLLLSSKFCEVFFGLFVLSLPLLFFGASKVLTFSERHMECREKMEF